MILPLPQLLIPVQGWMIDMRKAISEKLSVTLTSYIIVENSTHKTTKHTDQDPCRVQLDFFIKEQPL